MTDILSRDSLGAFCRHTHVALEGAQQGPLAGLSFGAKDLFDIAGYRTGAGNPDWLRTHEVATRTAPAVQRVLDAGAHMAGKTHTEELAYSLNGENAHYGTPVNPNAPGRIPGGSSSGSASAVAGGLVDFALGTDTSGSVRLPASYCGVFGIRTTHGRIPLDGTVPLSPSYDAVGWFARDADMLLRVGQVMLDDKRTPPQPKRVLIADDAFERAGAAASRALVRAVERVVAALGPASHVSVSPVGLEAWMNDFRILQSAEAWEAHREWITRVQPKFGPGVRERFEWAAALQPDVVAAAYRRREAITRHMAELLADDTVLVLPTVPGIAPLCGLPQEQLNDFRHRSLAMLCISGHARLPQVTLPLATLDGCPLGLSIAAAQGQDMMLLQAAAHVAA